MSIVQVGDNREIFGTMTNPRQTNPRQDISKTGHNTDRTIPRQGHILDKDIS